jgi:hypothetical protein
MNKFAGFLAFALASALFGCTNPQYKTDSRQAQTWAKEVLQDSRSAPPAISLALSAIRPSDVPPSFWVGLAHRKDLPPESRRAFVARLFLDYLRPGMMFAEICGLASPCQWLREEDVEVAYFASGVVPLDLRTGDTLVVLRVLPEAAGKPTAVYMSFKQALTKQAVIDGLAHGVSATPWNKVRLRAVGPRESATKQAVTRGPTLTTNGVTIAF